MSADPSQLLRQLEPAVRAAGRGPNRTQRLPLERQGFDDLLQLVSSGRYSSGLPMSLSPELEDSIDADQRQRLAAAADLAEQSGIGQALMLLDGRGLLVDVAQRHVMSELGPSDGNESRLVNEIDAAVLVGGADPSMAPLGSPVPTGPRAEVLPRGVLVPGSPDLQRG